MTQTAKLDYPKLEIRMYVSTQIEQTHRITACAKEPWTVQWLESMPPGGVLYDVGANVGPYTLIAAALGHTVVAIEPGYANFNRLCENLLLNDLQHKVIPLCLAVGRAGHDCPVLEQHPEPGYSGGGKRIRMPMLPLLDVALILGAPFPTHIKVDTDGNEAEVIEGTRGLFQGSWMVEVQDGQEQRINALLGEPAEVWTHRDGQWAARAPGQIKGMHMARYGGG